MSARSNCRSCNLIFKSNLSVSISRFTHLQLMSKFANKMSRRLFPVCLPDSVLAFHKHGMQGRSFKNGEVTQEISDPSRTYRLLGSDKYVSNVVKIIIYI